MESVQIPHLYVTSQQTFFVNKFYNKLNYFTIIVEQFFVLVSLKTLCKPDKPTQYI